MPGAGDLGKHSCEGVRDEEQMSMSLDVIYSRSNGVRFLQWWFQVSALVAAKSCNIMVAGPEAVLSNLSCALGVVLTA